MFSTAIKTIIFGSALLLIPARILASSADIAELRDMDLIGEARMQVLFWDIYDARLLAPEGRLEAGEPFALSLTYLRDLEGEKIAARSIEEMRKQGLDDEAALARWYRSLVEIIPDVGESDEIVGFAAADGSTRFYLDGQLIGEVWEPEFTRAFFDIWLGEKSSEPRLRDQLLGDIQ
jgi:hypothetical protein